MSPVLAPVDPGPLREGHDRRRRVRRDLLDADPHLGTTVAELAARWGFAHTGRFRVAYSRMFDEGPEQTLHR